MGLDCRNLREAKHGVEKSGDTKPNKTLNTKLPALPASVTHKSILHY